MRVAFGDYLVLHPTPEGDMQHHFVEDFHAAAVLAEQLVNEDTCTRARIFHLDEISVDFKPYYRVEIQHPTTSATGRSR